jgi:hypothetical protein
MNYITDNTVKIAAMLFALVIYLTLSGIYSLLSPAIVFQLFINKLLPLIIDIAPLSLKLFTFLLRNSSRYLSEEMLNLLIKINKVSALF